MNRTPKRGKTRSPSWSAHFLSLYIEKNNPQMTFIILIVILVDFNSELRVLKTKRLTKIKKVNVSDAQTRLMVVSSLILLFTLVKMGHQVKLLTNNRFIKVLIL